MQKVDFERHIKTQMISDLQRYLEDELSLDIGQFDTEFLLDFMFKQYGADIYNKGLNDAKEIFERKIIDVSDEIYEIEQESKYR